MPYLPLPAWAIRNDQTAEEPRADARRGRITRCHWISPPFIASLAIGLLATGALGCSGDSADRAIPRLVVLGIDGMDAALTRSYLLERRLPNLAELARSGSFIELGTSNPPQSPVAWSHFITGSTSVAHGIYDFVHRDPDQLAPYLSTSRVNPPRHSLEAFGWRFSLGAPEMQLLRDGEPFWAPLAQKGIPATVLKIPAHFPPIDDSGARTLSGMGTPDLLGTYGTFQFITDDPAWAKRTLNGGILHRLERRGGLWKASLHGPPNPMRTSDAPMTLPVEIGTNAARTAALVRVAGTERLLRAGEWSDWLPVEFDPGKIAAGVPGMVRLYLKSLAPHIRLYVSPINIDPTAPALPITSPPEWAQELGREVGRFYTQGMPEDTKALESGVLSDDDFLAQADLIFDEERALLLQQLRTFRGGLLFHYFSLVDQVSHMFFGGTESSPSPRLAHYTNVIPRLYQRIDEVVGQVRAAVGKNTTIIVMSDHGFGPYRYKVNLNTWLARQGYLTLREKPEPGALGHLEWRQTQAYALGLNQLFVNLRGREANGIVSRADRPALLDRLQRELESWIDGVSGGRVVSRIFRPPSGKHPDRTPDLIVGFSRGYRSSDQSATGIVEDEMVSPNQAKWSSDHCVDPALVPGVLFSSRRLRETRGSLIDLAPTILSVFGLPPAQGTEGKPLF